MDQDLTKGFYKSQTILKEPSRIPSPSSIETCSIGISVETFRREKVDVDPAEEPKHLRNQSKSIVLGNHKPPQHQKDQYHRINSKMSNWRPPPLNYQCFFFRSCHVFLNDQLTLALGWKLSHVVFRTVSYRQNAIGLSFQPDIFQLFYIPQIEHLIDVERLKPIKLPRHQIQLQFILIHLPTPFLCSNT